MTSRHLPFFVYGTLLPGERNHRLLRDRVDSWTPAVLPGALLFHGLGPPYPYPYAVPDPAGTGTVRGAVAAVPGGEGYGEVLAELDQLEDYRPGNAHNHYERAVVRVRTAVGTLDAWTYLAAERIARELLLSGIPVRDGDWRRRAGE